MDKLERDFINEISTGNLARVRSFLTYSVIWDIDKKDSIMKLVRIAEKNNIFEESVGQFKELPKAQWNEGYQDSVQTDLMLNYSKERFLYFLKVVEYLNGKDKQSNIKENIGNKNDLIMNEVKKTQIREFNKDQHKERYKKRTVSPKKGKKNRSFY